MNKGAVFAVVALLMLSVAAVGQTPEIFDVSEVVAGAQRIDTTYFLAIGRWSDAGTAAVMSTEIHCYKRFGFCEEADANLISGEASVGLDSYDILRWDSNELIAVKSSAICVVNTLRVDFRTKRVSMNSAATGEKGMPMPNGKSYCEYANLGTAFLGGSKDELKKIKAEAAKTQPGK